MSTFHVNPETGNVGKCSAKIACPFGGVEDHFATREQAASHFEACQTGSFSFSPTPTHLRSFTDEDRAVHTRTARELLDLLSHGGAFELPDEMLEEWETNEEGEEFLNKEEVRVGNFRLLASGAAVNAYLHEPSKTVYKVPHFGSVGELWSSSVSKTLVDLARAEKKAYESLDNEKLAHNNLVYTPTRYFGLKTEAGPVPIVVQSYLDPDEYEPHYLNGTEQNALAGLGVWDLNMGNVRLHKASGELVLLDCIPAWD